MPGWPCQATADLTPELWSRSKVAAREYGFWANVNPKVPHPRWWQATERVLGGQTRVPTQL